MYKSIAAAYQRLACDDGSHCAQDYRDRTHALRKHHVERVQIMYCSYLRVIPVCEYPDALSHVVEYEAGLYKRPAAQDVFLANMAHVRIERFGSGRTEEYASEYHEPCLVARTEEHLYGIDRIYRPYYCQIAQ